MVCGGESPVYARLQQPIKAWAKAEERDFPNSNAAFVPALLFRHKRELARIDTVFGAD